MGSYFSAGGWSGHIRSITHDNNTSLAVATAGYGVQIGVVLHKEIDEPRPLGDKVYFHSPSAVPIVPISSDSSSGTKKNKSGSSGGKREKEGNKQAAKEASEWVMIQNQMALKLGNTNISIIYHEILFKYHCYDNCCR